MGEPGKQSMQMPESVEQAQVREGCKQVCLHKGPVLSRLFPCRLFVHVTSCSRGSCVFCAALLCQQESGVLLGSQGCRVTDCTIQAAAYELMTMCKGHTDGILIMPPRRGLLRRGWHGSVCRQFDAHRGAVCSMSRVQCISASRMMCVQAVDDFGRQE